METQTNDTTKTRPTFGQRVRIKAKAVRRTIRAPQLPPEKSDLFTLTSYYVPGESRWRVWSRKELDTPVTALYIGYRKLQDGLTRWEGDDVGMVFWRKRDFDGWLVVLGERQNPVLVFPEDVELVEYHAAARALLDGGA